ncbi:MAG: Fe-S protein assembly co-chaperone HscB [Alphaproteobacteria bacterium]|nr:Fe-S protein assembly co-chaperone HscB [Alphaproteobacteria bacterium]
MSRSCWSCSLEVEDLWFCSDCHKLQGVTNIHAFERLGMPVEFDMPYQTLEEKYKSIQRQVHPDRFITAPRQEKIYAAQQSAALNDAYMILKKSDLRAQEMLKIAGHKSGNIEEQSLDDPELLMRIIELREQLVDIETQAQLFAFQDELQQEIVQTENHLSQAFATKALDRAASLLNRLRYFNKIRIESMERKVS